MKSLSIIVPIFKGKKYIEGIIKQVERAASNHQCKVELIFVNDYPSEHLLEEYSSTIIDIVVVNSDINRGIHGARVYGLSLAKNEFVVFLDQDDIIFPNYIHSQITTIEDANAVVCRGISEGMPLYTDDRKFETTISFDYLLNKGNPIASPGQVMIRKESIPTEWINNIIKNNCSDDYFLWICMMAKGCKFSLNNNVVFEHVVDGTNTSLNYELMMKSDDEMLKIVDSLNLLSSVEYDALYVQIKNRYRKKLEGLQHFRTIAMNLSSLISCRAKGNSIGVYFIKKGITNVSIYGAGLYGKTICSELCSEGIVVDCFIDRNAKYIETDIPIYRMDEIDNISSHIIIVALTQDASELKKAIVSKYNVRALSLNEIIFEMEKGL